VTVRSLTVGGFRGLSTTQRLEFAIPTGATGSGITVLVGTNNAGKSSIVEALRALASDRPTSSFSEGKRNKAFGDAIDFTLEFADATTRRLRSLRPGGSQAERVSSTEQTQDIVVVPSRRTFSAFFNDPGYPTNRQQYAGHGLPVQREPLLSAFTNRLFELEKDPSRRDAFNGLLAKVLGYVPDWAVDQSDSGQSYLKFLWQDEAGTAQSHSSDGLGDGLISLFVIIDSLHDSQPDSVIVIDEPELSLHPQFQRRLRAVISEFAADRQVVYATHSPYLIDWSDVTNGASITRVYKTHAGTQLATPSSKTLRDFVSLGRGNQYNPHVLGTQAIEVFFLDGGVLLAEGQEDVVMLPTAIGQVGPPLDASFFGWGVGGAENMRKVCALMQELGYQSVAGVFDNDKGELAMELAGEFPQYSFICIPADDVRPKKARPQTEAKSGLLDESGILRPELKEQFEMAISRIREYLTATPRGGEIV
jgi:predicted ATPase